MPRLSVWFVKASLIYLAAGFTLGALMLSNKGFLWMPAAYAWLPAHMEMLLPGWLVQLAMGVVFWIAPRFSGAQPRGRQSLAWAAFFLLNAGIGLAILQPVIHLSGLLLAGRALESGAVILFGLGTWQRIKPTGR